MHDLNPKTSYFCISYLKTLGTTWEGWQDYGQQNNSTYRGENVTSTSEPDTVGPISSIF